MTFDFSEFNSFCREQNMDYDISEGIAFKAVREMNDCRSHQDDNILMAPFVSNEYMCDKCNEHPAQTWNDDIGAVCNSCCGPIPNYVEVISEESDFNF